MGVRHLQTFIENPREMPNGKKNISILKEIENYKRFVHVFILFKKNHLKNRNLLQEISYEEAFDCGRLYGILSYVATKRRNTLWIPCKSLL